MHVGTAYEALASGCLLEIRYDGFTRDVEVHACGYTKDGNAVMRVWQVRGGSVHDEPVGWKLLRLDEAVALALLDETSAAPWAGYRRGDRAMARIICQV